MLTRVEIPGLICSAALLLAGLSLGIWHWRHWNRLAVADLPYQWVRNRRRMLVAALIALEGLLLATADTLLPVMERSQRITPRQMALSWAGVVVVMLLVAVWIALLALGDMLHTASRSRLERLRMRQEQRALRYEIERFHAGHDGDDT